MKLALQSFAGSQLIRGGVPGPQACWRICILNGRSVLVAPPNAASVIWMTPSELQTNLGLDIAPPRTPSENVALQYRTANADGTDVHLGIELYYLGRLENAAHPLAIEGQPKEHQHQHLFAAEASNFLRAKTTRAAAYLSQNPGAPTFAELRALWLHPLASPTDLSRAGHAIALSQWHQSHAFCPRCGSGTVPTSFGARRTCTAANHHRLYPRTDPVMIVLCQSPDGQYALLGRPRNLPYKRMLTCLSGFIEPAEGIEEAVGREVMEEAGVRVDEGSVRILGSQPWPMGRGGSSELMVGCVATALSTSISVNAEEMDVCCWVGRDAVKKALELSVSQREQPYGERDGDDGGGSKDHSPEFTVPPPSAIAHHLMHAWVHHGAEVAGWTGAASL
jgi:NADH pyrophosphatase NudC (nudix superfamily)